MQSLRIRDAKIPRNVAERLQEKVEFREKRIDESGDTADVKGSEKANIIAEENLKNIRDKVGLI